jgi:hypothetical protein
VNQDAGPQGADALEAQIAAFREALRDWPEGIRQGNAWATVEDCQAMLGRVKAVRRVAGSEAHGDFLNLLDTRLNINIGQLRSDEGKCFF